jgi:uncharacterized protein YbjT (DUF2867 family)
LNNGEETGKPGMKLVGKILGGIVVLLILLGVAFWASLRPNVPATAFELTGPESVGNLNVMIFGATRNTGLEVARILLARGDSVTAFVRETSNRSQLEALEQELGVTVNFALGDAMDAASIAAALDGGDFDAVITTIGSISADPPPDYQGNANIFDAAVAAGVNRAIMISTVGAGDSLQAAPWPSRLFLTKIIPLKTQAEDHLRESGLDYTIIRPGGLPPGPGSGRGILSEDRSTFGFIARPDLARLIIGALDDDRTIGKTFTAIDPQRKSPWDDS